MKVIAVERRHLGKYSPVSATALGIEPPRPIPVSSRTTNSSIVPLAIVVSSAIAPNKRDAADRDPLVPEIAGHRRYDQITRHQAELVGRQDPPEHLARNAPLARDLRRDIGDDLHDCSR